MTREERHRVINADCRDAMRAMDADSIDAIVTDPPYGLGFMGKGWDDFARQREYQARGDEGYGDRGVLPGYGRGGTSEQREKFRRRSNVSFYEFSLAWAKEALRVAKPGAHIVAFGGTRTFHRLTCAIEDAGWEVRDCLSWLYGSGFPKSLDVSKAIDKAAGAGREVVGRYAPPNGMTWNLRDDVTRSSVGAVGHTSRAASLAVTAPATDAARTWQGWGTALKPAWEPIILARKPLAGTVASNVLAHGTGALNIDGCRIGTGKSVPSSVSRSSGVSLSGSVDGREIGTEGGHDPNVGRWPANVAIDEEAAAMLGEPSRFFYTAKAASDERGAGNTHPTVKPVALMRWLVRMVTPPGGLVLDPFCGSGSTLVAASLEGFSAVGVEREPEYAAIARGRIYDSNPMGL